MDTFFIRVPFRRSTTHTPVVYGCSQIEENEMRRNIFPVLIALGSLFGSFSSSPAQVKQVEMHIAGYLCGN
jgi:hypothetical protein